MIDSSHHFCRQEKGAVSVFLCAVMALLLIFYALCLDFLQIQLAKRELNLALQAATKSLLAVYHEPLREFGLFASHMTEVEMADLTKIVVAGHQINEISDLQVRWNRTLANSSEFELQVYEEMKLHAPAEWSKQLFQRWQILNPGRFLKNSQTISKISERIKDLAEKRNKIVENAKQALQKLKTEIARDYNPTLQEIQKISDWFKEIERIETELTGNWQPEVRVENENISWDADFTGLMDQLKNVSVFEEQQNVIIDKLLAALQQRIPSDTDVADQEKQEQTLNNVINHLNQQVVSCPDRQKPPSYSFEYEKSFAEVDHLDSLSMWSHTNYKNLLLAEYALQKFEINEVNYVINGFESCSLNEWTTKAKVFAIRMVLRFIEYVIQPNIGSTFLAAPWLFFLTALSTAAVKAEADLRVLTEGGGVPLLEFQSFGFETEYKDYLRILLLTVNKQDKIKRLQKLVEENIGISLSELPTSVGVQAVLPVKLKVYPVYPFRIRINRTAAYLN